jgi:hypothetical protein
MKKIEKQNVLQVIQIYSLRGTEKDIKNQVLSLQEAPTQSTNPNPLTKMHWLSAINLFYFVLSITLVCRTSGVVLGVKKVSKVDHEADTLKIALLLHENAHTETRLDVVSHLQEKTTKSSAASKGQGQKRHCGKNKSKCRCGRYVYKTATSVCRNGTVVKDYPFLAHSTLHSFIIQSVRY